LAAIVISSQARPVQRSGLLRSDQGR
jgi:hypothetical protein